MKNSTMSKNIVISTIGMHSFNGVSRWNELAALTLAELGHDVTLVTNGFDEEFVKPNFKDFVKGIEFVLLCLIFFVKTIYIVLFIFHNLHSLSNY